MGKYLLILLVLPSLMYSQYTLVPDLNFENFLEDNGMGDGIPNNGQVLTANIENVTTLNIPSWVGVADLTGIEGFISLEFLNFSYNQVESIDLSQNTELRLFGCIFNELTVLDLSNNTKLEQIAVNNNFLETLILNSEYLTIVECWENFLPQLDLSLCPALTLLNCNTNQLTNLDLSQNVALAELSCGVNNLTSLDTSNNIALYYLVAGYNHIGSLDFKQNENLDSVALAFIPELNQLDMRNGNNENIAYFNVQGTNDLKCIYVDDASATYLEDWYKDSFTTFVNNEAECDALAVSDQEIEKPLIYPNPAKDVLTISISTPATYTITGVNGKTLKTGTLNLGLTQISIDEFSTGLYFFNITTENGTVTEKIIKE